MNSFSWQINQSINGLDWQFPTLSVESAAAQVFSICPSPIFDDQIVGQQKR